jgi:protein-disulfide isomerase
MDPRIAATVNGLSPAETHRLALRTRGAPTAPLTVLELTDFQCDDCCRFVRETLPALERQYIDKGKIRWIVVNWPKAYKHRHAVRAAEYALSAAAQGRFWAMHDELFRTFEQWTGLDDPESAFNELATNAGVNVDLLQQALATGDATVELQADAGYIDRWGVSLVPSFNVGGVVVMGTRSADYLSGVIDAVLHAKHQTPA